MLKTYAEVREYIRKGIEFGDYLPNQKLPAAEKLAKEFGVSRLTVHRALHELASEGLIFRKPGQGTLIADPKRHVVGTVAVLLPDAHFSSGFAAWFMAMSEILLREGLHVVPYNLGIGISHARQVLNRILSSAVQGVVLIPPAAQESREVLGMCKDKDIPVVIAGKFTDLDVNVSSVSTNHHQVGRVLAQHLLKVGHSKFAFLTACHTQDALERLDGFLDEVGNSGGELTNENRFEVSDLNEIPLVIEDLINRKDRPTAIFAANDIIASEVMVAIDDFGYKIPEDIAVVGVGNESWSKALISPLTTVQLPLVKEGEMLARMLLHTIRGTFTDCKKVEIDSELIVRKSCGYGLIR